MNSKQALLTMGEYIRQTYPLMQQERLRYDEEQLFKAANETSARRRRLEYEKRVERIDHSLNTVKFFKRVKKTCTCRFCEEKYYLVTWEGRNEQKWPDKEGSCIFCVTLHLARLALLYKRDNDPFLIDKLRERCITSYGKEVLDKMGKA